MRVDSINNYSKPNFGAIVLRDSKAFSDTLLSAVEQKTRGKFNSEVLKGKRLIDEVIKSDFDTPKLMNRFNKLVKSQEKNPVNIYVDLFTPEDEIPLDAEGWFQKATVGKMKFSQPTTQFFGLPVESRIAFLEKACFVANIMNFLGIKK